MACYPQRVVGRSGSKEVDMNSDNRHVVQNPDGGWDVRAPGAQPPRSHSINAELAKKHPESLEYIVVHEMGHHLERNHGGRFTKVMDGFMAYWRSRGDQLNDAPLADESRS